MAVAAAAAVSLCALPVLQGRYQHREQINAIRELKELEMEASRRHHEETLKSGKDRYNHGHSVETECYAQAMSLRVHLARRETMRDVWQQRNLLNQTQVIITSLMFAQAFESLSQGVLPLNTAPWLLYCYSATLSTSITVLVVAIWSCYKLQSRMAQYDTGNSELVYNCGKTHSHFNSYFDCHCRALQKVALFAFYTGTAFVMLAATALQGAKFIHLYEDPPSAVIFAVLVAIPILIVLVGSKAVQGKSHDMAVDYGGLIWAWEQDMRKAEEVRRQYGSGGAGHKGQHHRSDFAEHISGFGVPDDDITSLAPGGPAPF